MILDRRIPWTYMVGKIKWDLAIVAVFAFMIDLISRKSDFTIPSSLGAFMGTSIALLLSFKLSQSYDRWWEARKVWGCIVNDSRSLVLQLQAFVKQTDNPVVEQMARRQIGWCYALGESLRHLDPLKDLKRFVSEDELERIAQHKNVPLGTINEHKKDLRTLFNDEVINEFQQLQIDSTLVRLVESMGKCERIKNTYFPKTYRITLHLFIYTFLVLLSFSFGSFHQAIDVLLLVAISIPFFLLEKIAYHIQDPFENRPTDTSVTAISQTIETNIKQLIGDSDLPEPTVSNGFYLM